jgi:CubicO group peptidase (beta-lactamase class C family)
MIASLVQQKPWWEPGTSHGYHVNTFGFLVGELISRIRNTTHQQLLQPLRNFIGEEMYWGVPSEQLHDVATLYWHDMDQQRETLKTLSEASMHVLAYSNPPNFSGMGAVNSTAWRKSVHPSTNLHATSRAVALAYESVRSTALGIHPVVLEQTTTTVSQGTDEVLGADTHFGVGFQLPTATRRFGPHNEAFGHYGAGGSMGFCDPVSQICVGYVMNQMGRGWQNSRNQSLIDSIYTCL